MISAHCSASQCPCTRVTPDPAVVFCRVMAVTQLYQIWSRKQEPDPLRLMIFFRKEVPSALRWVELVFREKRNQKLGIGNCLQTQSHATH